jgi:hypothetical protein
MKGYQSNGSLAEFLGNERRSTVAGSTAVLGIQTSSGKKNW